jgi:hypothetical protein
MANPPSWRRLVTRSRTNREKSPALRRTLFQQRSSINASSLSGYEDGDARSKHENPVALHERA